MSNSFSQTLLSNLWTACWQGGLLILAVWLVCRCFKKLDPTIRQGLWWLACLKLLVAAFWVHPLALPVLPAKTAVGANLLAPAYQSANQMPAGVLTMGQTNTAFPWIDVLMGVWLVGALIVILAAVKSGFEARRMAKASVSIDDSPLGNEMRGLAAGLGLTVVPRLVMSDKVSSPCVIGHLRPTVIVPKDFQQTLTGEEQRMAIAHELAHIRRAHLWLALVPSCAFTLFYFFPPVWLACREWATDRESSCDHDALLATGAKPKAYGEMLLKIAKGDHRRLIPGLGATRQFHTLRRRMSSIVDGATSRPMRWASATLLALTGVLIVPITLAAPSSKEVGVLKNAGFEDGLDSPDGWTAINPGGGFELAWDTNVAHSGSRSVRITRTTKRYWPIAQWTREIPYDGRAQSIEFGAWIKADHAGKAVLDAQFEGPNHFWSHQWVAYVGEQSPGRGLATHDWAPYSGVVRIPAGTKTIKVSLQDYGPGTVWMDDAFAQFLTVPSPEALAK